MSSPRYSYAVPTTGNTITPPDWCELLALDPAGGLSALTVNMPKNPIDGQDFAISSTQAVTTLTMAVQSGSQQTLKAAATSIVAGVTLRWRYFAYKFTWMPA